MSVLSPSVVESFVHIRLINCTAIAAVTVLIWDYLILLPDEVALVWPTSWNISKYLFLLNRYLAFVDPIMLIYVVMFGDDEKVFPAYTPYVADLTHCIALGLRTHVSDFIVAIGFILGQCILILRAYAVWGKQFNRLYAVIFGIYLGSFGVSLWTVAKYVGATGAPALGMTGCTLFFKNRFGWFDVALFLGAEFISALLMVIKAIQHCEIWVVLTRQIMF
ncbi:hypothetical protein BD410DRAFT_896130 [Rickenella mellea]|uniref:DUF6533 domain-containing protein n=1 Tax=Rickenella mellea TaxID=50990 RepID=A0A4Y7QE89_9AGAM|nr:hypothetical protein BD410DRAFT_896130 [Rickenella mellea]